MAENLPDLGARIELDIEQYIRNLRTAVNQADTLDSALKDIVNQANLAAKALNGIGSNNIKLNVDTSDIEIAKRLADDLNTNVTFKVNVDDDEIVTANRLRSDLTVNTSFRATVIDDDLDTARDKRADLNENTLFTAGVNAQPIRTALSLAEDLNQTTVIKATVDDQALRTVKGKVDDLDTSFDVDANDNTGDVLRNIEGKLNDIRGLAVIDLVLNAAEFATQLQSLPILSTLLDTDNAIGELNARVATDIPNAGKIILSVYQQAFGDSQEQVALVIAELANAGVATEDLASSAMAAFTAADLGGEDVIDVVQKLSNVVRAGLATDFTDATDIYTTGIKNGLNTSADWLDSLEEYSVNFAAIGVSAQGMFNIFQQGLGDGVRDTDKLADAYKELGFNIDTALSEPESPQADVFTRLGLLDEAAAAKAGEISGDVFVSQLNSAIMRGLADESITAADVISVFGTPGEEVTIPILTEIDPMSSVFDTEGATADAAADLYDDLGTGLEGFIRIVETELATAIDEAFDITGFINDLKAGISEFSALIADGVELDVAFDQAFNLGGDFLQFESAVNNFALSVLEFGASIFEFFAGVQDFLGKGDEANRTREIAAVMREEISRLAAGQFAFDIGIARTSAEASGAIQTAQARGVDTGDLSEAISNTINNALATGDLDIAQMLALSAKQQSAGGYGDFITTVGDQINAAAASGDIAAIADLGPRLFDFRGSELITSDVADSLNNTIAGVFELGDFGAVIDIADVVNEVEGFEGYSETIANSLVSEFDKAFSGGDFSTSIDIADAIVSTDTEAGSRFLDTFINTGQVDEAFAGVRAQFETALSSGDLDVAAKMAEQINDPEIWEALKAGANEAVIIVGNEFTTLVTSAANASTQTVNSMNNVAGAMDSVGTTAGRQIPTAQALLIQFATQTKQPIDELQLSLNAVLNTINAIADAPNAANAANSAAQRATGGGEPPPGFASGGSFSGLGRVHADELLMAAPPGQEISVLNAQTSNVVMDAVAAVLGGMNLGGGGSTNNKTVNQNIVFNTQSTAEDINGLNATSAAMRGF